MSEVREVRLAPAWVLHRYPYRETSLIVEALSRDHGRIGLVARGARRRGQPALAPFAPLLLSFRGRGELATLIAAEPCGPAHEFSGKCFLAACYLNELVLRLLPRDDPAPRVHELYGEALATLAPEPASAVRCFEGRLLRTLGWVPPFGCDGSGAALDPVCRYRYDPERGPVPISAVSEAGDEGGVSGSLLRAIAAERFDDPPVQAAAARIFRDVIAYHLGGRRLKTLEVARAMTRAARGSIEA